MAYGLLWEQAEVPQCLGAGLWPVGCWPAAARAFLTGPIPSVLPFTGPGRAARRA